ncbi:MULTISPECIES: putative type VI secretion system effector [Burkholderia]|uniref:Uncharacterized protein n=1 Tax=Burkholderia aenigmatica TaxID=2015348 RepID=A0ABY6Y3D9_9BURK|nr:MULTISPECIES: putative type VI secretion system effector [Burkholderia]VWD29520.1 hypothetical protein BLA17378_07215 [Burkholderia aenigmatica]VWD55839.1 hypothetical protein BLA18628_06587 [Burkholderia aenigmatica]
MTADVKQSFPTQLLRGRIANLRKTRQRQEFLFTDSDRNAMGATAVVAGLAGLGGVALGLSASAMDTSEEADLLEFDLGEKKVRAWVWVSVFKEGDEVEVVAEQSGDIWIAFGIRRLGDQVLALHPHCSRGRYAHYKATARWWIGLTGSLLLVMNILGIVMAYFKDLHNWAGIFDMFLWGGVGVFAITGVIAFRIAWKMMGFVRLAEGIFSGFGWKNVKSIDLPAITKKSKKPGEPGVLGVLYFRY